MRNYVEGLLTELENQTMSNCVYLGYGLTKRLEILADMRAKGLDYISRRKLQQYR